MDLFSRAIVGWSAATSKRAKLVLDALDMALWRMYEDGGLQRLLSPCTKRFPHASVRPERW